MKCKKNSKHCSPILCIMAKGTNYVCSGVSKTPTKYKDDKIWLCLSGCLIKNTKIEMTKEEALIIISALSLAASDDRLTDIQDNKRS